jgi:hypothetical protein
MYPRSPSVTINTQPATPAAPTAPQLCNQRVPAIGTITDRLTGTGITYSIDGATMYQHDWNIYRLLQRNSVTLKCCRMYLCLTSVTIIRNQQHLLHQLRLQLCKQRAVATGTITVTARLELESALMVRLIPTRLEYLMWLLQHSVTVKNAAGCISAPTSVTINTQPATPAAPTAAATLQPTCRSNWNDNCDCSDWNWNHV